MKLLLLLLLGSVLANAQPAVTLDQANKLLNDSRWNDAASAFTSLSQTTPENGAAWVGLGEARLQNQQFDAAQQAFQKALDLKFRPVLNRANLARVAAARGNKDEAFRILRSMIAAGLGGAARSLLRAYPEFASLRSDPEFSKLEAEMRPCRDAVYHQFDFWIGKWKVKLPNGQAAGVNEVTREQEGCLLVEHWKANTGLQTGTSFNYYDVRDKQWHQLYIDNSGNAGAFPAMAGGLVDGKMVLLTDPTQPSLSRWTWYVISSGKVRQMAEQSTDGGKTWNTTWDSIYEKVQ